MPFGEELFEPRGFGPDVEQSVVYLDVMHIRERLLAKTGGGGLVLTDSPEALRMVATLPATREADDTLELVSKGVLTGLRRCVSSDKRAANGEAADYPGSAAGPSCGCRYSGLLGSDGFQTVSA